MKKIRILTLAAVVCAGLSSCNEDDGAAVQAVKSQFPDDYVVRVAGSIDGAPLTRAGFATDNLDNFWLRFVTGDGSQGYNYCEHIQKTGGEWALAVNTHPMMLWKDSKTPVAVSAAVFGGKAFTDADFADGALLTLPVDQSADDGSGVCAADLLWMKRTVIQDPSSEQTLLTDGKLNVTMSHALAKMDITLTLGSDVAAAGLNNADDLTAFTVTSKDKFYFDEKDGVKPFADARTVDVKAFRTSFEGSDNSVAKYECVVVPQQLAAGQLKIQFKIGSHTLTWTNADAIALEGGQRCTLNIDVSTATVPGQELTESVPEGFVDLGMVVHGKKIYWATKNVGADKPWDTGDYYAWGEIATKGTYSWGNYKHGNGGNNNVSKKYNSGDSKATLEPEDDAATQMFDSRASMPTNEEMQALVNNCVWVWTGSYKGHQFANGQNAAGYIVYAKKEGESPEYNVDEDVHIFIPATGCRNGDNLYNCGARLEYYSSSLKSFSDQTCAAILYCSNSRRSAGERGFRYIGRSIRAVWRGEVPPDDASSEDLGN